jgi:hypothetical protein
MTNESKEWTVWDFRNTSDTTTPIVIAKRAEPLDRNRQHEYQRVLGQVSADTAQDAIDLVMALRRQQGR